MKTTGRSITKILEAQSRARRRYTYFVSGNSDSGYQWMLVTANNDTLASSAVFARKADCLKALRAVQRCAHAADVIDDAI